MTPEEIKNAALAFAKANGIAVKDTDVSEAVAFAKEITNAQIDELLRKLDPSYRMYVWYQYLRKEIEDTKIQ